MACFTHQTEVKVFILIPIVIVGQTIRKARKKRHSRNSSMRMNMLGLTSLGIIVMLNEDTTSWSILTLTNFAMGVHDPLRF